jgi:hypothetical protein
MGKRISLSWRAMDPLIRRFALIASLLTFAFAASGEARADCATAAIAPPLAGHYALNVDNRCAKPAQLAVCWRWPGGVQAETYRLSKSGRVTFLGPEATTGSAATSTWLHCLKGECRIECAATAANTPPPVPTAPAPAIPANPAQQASLPPAPPPPPQWGAIAAGIDTAQTGGTGHVAVGWALGDSVDAARLTALDQCKRQGVANCQIVDVYDHGCGYITTGNNGSGGYGWGTAATAQRAVELCASQGLSCQKPIGGCVRQAP